MTRNAAGGAGREPRRAGSLLSRSQFSSYRVGIDNLGPTPGYLKMVFLFFGWDHFLGGVLWRSRVQVAPGGNYGTVDMDVVSVGQDGRLCWSSRWRGHGDGCGKAAGFDWTGSRAGNTPPCVVQSVPSKIEIFYF